jgi:hypothetical protein
MDVDQFYVNIDLTRPVKILKKETIGWILKILLYIRLASKAIVNPAWWQILCRLTRNHRQ